MLIITFGICLTWFVFAVLAVSTVKLFHVHGINGFGAVTSWVLLVVGYLVYLFIVPLLLGFRSNYRTYLKQIGLADFNQQSGLILLTFVVFTLVISILAGNIHLLFFQNQYPLIAYVEPPLLEELMFRGIIMSLLLRAFPQWFSILWSSLLFSLIHVALGPTGMINAFIGALFVFSTLRVQTKNIWSGVFAHFTMVRGLPGHVWLGWELLEVILAMNWLAKKFKLWNV